MTSSLSANANADGPDFYGTRLSTVLLVRRDGRVRFVERDIWQLSNIVDSDGIQVSRGDPRFERAFSFDMDTTSSSAPV